MISACAGSAAQVFLSFFLFSLSRSCSLILKFKKNTLVVLLHAVQDLAGDYIVVVLLHV
jgi:hypothetical protein